MVFKIAYTVERCFHSGSTVYLNNIIMLINSSKIHSENRKIGDTTFWLAQFLVAPSRFISYHDPPEKINETNSLLATPFFTQNHLLVSISVTVCTLSPHPTYSLSLSSPFTLLLFSICRDLWCMLKIIIFYNYIHIIINLYT